MTAASSMSSAASPLPWGAPPGPPSTTHVADGVAQSVARLEAREVARQVVLELDDRDGLPDAGAALREELVQPEDGGHLRRRVAPGEGRHALGRGAGLGRRGVRDLGVALCAPRPRPRPRPHPPGPRRRKVRPATPIPATRSSRGGPSGAWSAPRTGRRGRPRRSPRRRGRRGSAATPCSRRPGRTDSAPGPSRAVCRARRRQPRPCRSPATRCSPGRASPRSAQHCAGRRTPRPPRPGSARRRPRIATTSDSGGSRTSPGSTPRRRLGSGRRRSGSRAPRRG